MVGGGGLKLEINIPLQRIYAKRKGLINEGGVISSEYGKFNKPIYIWHVLKGYTSLLPLAVHKFLYNVLLYFRLSHVICIWWA